MQSHRRDYKRGTVLCSSKRKNRPSKSMRAASSRAMVGCKQKKRSRGHRRQRGRQADKCNGRVSGKLGLPGQPLPSLDPSLAPQIRAEPPCAAGMRRGRGRRQR